MTSGMAQEIDEMSRPWLESVVAPTVPFPRRLPLSTSPAPASPALDGFHGFTLHGRPVDTRDGRMQSLLDDADVLSEPDVAFLASAAIRVTQVDRYAEALLVARRAADRSGRAADAERAAHLLAELVGRAAAAGCRANLDERARWTVLAERASWALADAARAIVVRDLIPDAHLRLLTLPWAELVASRRA